MQYLINETSLIDICFINTQYVVNHAESCIQIYSFS